MEKIIRTSAVSGSRKLAVGPAREPGDRQPRRENSYTEEMNREKTSTRNKTAEKKTSDKAVSTAKQQTAATAAPSVPSADIAGVESALIKNLSEENERLKKDCAEFSRQLQERDRELESLRVRDREVSHNAGYEEGKTAAAQQWRQKLLELDALLSELADCARGEITHLEKTAVEIAFAALCRIVEEKWLDREFVVAVVRNVLAKVDGDIPVNILVDARHRAWLEEHKDRLDSGAGARLTIVADTRVKAGGCILQTDAGGWDGRLETQLQRLKDALVTAAGDGE